MVIDDVQTVAFVAPAGVVGGKDPGFLGEGEEGEKGQYWYEHEPAHLI